jgi:CBS domain-containing protein
MLTPHTVGHVMTTDVIAVHPDAPFKDIAILLAHNNISAVPVIDDDRHVLGVVSETDLLSKESEQAPPDGHHLPLSGHQRRLRAKAAARRAHELMTKPALTVGPEQTVPTAARMLQRHGVTRLPVVDEHGTLIGIVSRRDLISLFVRTDREIATEVRQEVLDRAMQSDINAVSADVTDGVVVLNGRVDRRSLIPTAVALARRVEGVVDVIEHLNYDIDDTGFPASPVTADIVHGLLPRPR